MEKPTIKINGKTHKLTEISGRHWRIMGEFIESAPDYVDADFLEKHADFIAKFYEDVTAEDILDLPIEDILPASAAIRKYIMECLTVKLEKIEKTQRRTRHSNIVFVLLRAIFVSHAQIHERLSFIIRGNRKHVA